MKGQNVEVKLNMSSAMVMFSNVKNYADRQVTRLTKLARSSSLIIYFYLITAYVWARLKNAKSDY
jgi:hypothetical protein